MAFKGSDVWKIISKLKRKYNLDKSNNILAKSKLYLFVQNTVFHFSFMRRKNGIS